MENKKPLMIGAIVVIIAIAGYFLIKANNRQSVVDQATLDTSNTIDTATQLPTTTKETSGSGSTTTPPTPQASIYKDGTYTATGSYVSPGGRQGLQVTVTLKGDVIVSSNVVERAVDRESRQFQNKFISGYQQLVVGKNINAVKLGKVSGSSLTGAGFNDALAQIKAQAKS